MRDPSAFVPVSAGRKCVVLPVESVASESLKKQDVASFVDALCRNFSGWESFRPLVGFEDDERGAVRPVFEYPRATVIDATRYDPRLHAAEEEFKLAKGQVLLPVFSARGAPPDGFLEGLSAFIERHGVPFVIVTGWPIIEWIPESVGCLLTFGASPQVAAALSAVLSGKAEARGSLDRVL